MSDLKNRRVASNSKKAFWVIWAGVMVAMTGFVGYMTLELLNLKPSVQLASVSHRLADARSSDAANPELDTAASLLYSAQKVIDSESRKSWRLRSYDRARELIDRADRIVDRAHAQLELQS